VKDWLAYSGAFACALGMAALCYMAAFRTLMSGASYGFGGFVLLAVVLPLLAGLVAFGTAFIGFGGRRFDVQGWVLGFAFVALAAALAFGLIVVDVLEEIAATVLLVVVVYVGGLIMVTRASDA
jgi:hypothetical protein